jgi:hypothetical protein
MGDLGSSSRQIFQKVRDAGGTAHRNRPCTHAKQKGGTFHLGKKTALMSHSDTPPVP